jgi:hypothetical protein
MRKEQSRTEPSRREKRRAEQSRVAMRTEEPRQNKSIDHEGKSPTKGKYKMKKK